MEDIQHDVPATDDSSAPWAATTGDQGSAAETVGRLLANPRRIRRN